MKKIKTTFLEAPPNYKKKKEKKRSMLAYSPYDNPRLCMYTYNAYILVSVHMCIYIYVNILIFTGGTSGKEPSSQCRRM